jgi:sulfate transport system permease protein
VSPSVLPGFGLTLGVTVTYLSLIVLIPLAAMGVKAGTAGAHSFWEVSTSARTLSALKLSFGASFVAALVNAALGFLVAWVLVRYRFPGKQVVDALVDLPFAMPTAVSGIALTALYAPTGWVGQYLDKLGIASAYSQLGVVIALTFVSLPFVVRTLQPALGEIDTETEEAAASLGASRWATFWRVTVPTVFPALITGFTLALARAIGEYGSVAFIAGNKPFETEIAPVLILMKLEEYDYVGATVIASTMLIVSFVLLLAVNVLQGWSARRLGQSKDSRGTGGVK